MGSFVSQGRSSNCDDANTIEKERKRIGAGKASVTMRQARWSNCPDWDMIRRQRHDNERAHEMVTKDGYQP